VHGRVGPLAPAAISPPCPNLLGEQGAEGGAGLEVLWLLELAGSVHGEPGAGTQEPVACGPLALLLGEHGGEGTYEPVPLWPLVILLGEQGAQGTDTDKPQAFLALGESSTDVN